MSQGIDRLRGFVKRNPKEKLTTLLHHINVDSLRKAFFALKRKAAPGVDGVTWEEYAEDLDRRLADLADRVHSGSVPSAAGTAGRDTQAGRQHTTARHHVLRGHDCSDGDGEVHP